MQTFAHALMILNTYMMSKTRRFCFLSHLPNNIGTMAYIVKVILVPSTMIYSGINWVSVLDNLTCTPCDILKLKLTLQLLSPLRLIEKSWWKGPLQMVYTLILR